MENTDLMWYVNPKLVWANLSCVSTLTNLVGTKLEWTNLLAVGGH